LLLAPLRDGRGVLLLMGSDDITPMMRERFGREKLSGLVRVVGKTGIS